MTAELAPSAVAEYLEATAALVEAELRALGEEARWHPAPMEWCANEVLGHIVEAERRGFAGRIRRILAEEDPSFEPWDQDAVARERADCQGDPAAIRAEFAALRAESVTLVRGLRPDQLGRSGTHRRVGRLAVRDLLHEWVHHDRNHTRQLLANVQARVWPHMANAQRFAED